MELWQLTVCMPNCVANSKMLVELSAVKVLHKMADTVMCSYNVRKYLKHVTGCTVPNNKPGLGYLETL